MQNSKWGSALIRVLFAGWIGVGIWACAVDRAPEIDYPETDLSAAPLIPKPLSIVPTHDAFGLDRHVAIYSGAADGDFAEVAGFLASQIEAGTGLRLPVDGENPDGIHRAIYFNRTASDGGAGYQLYITRDSVLINSPDAEGAFHAVQTLRQLIPQSANDTLADYPIWPLPTGKITDQTEFAYRGAMLDVARHFFPVADVKKYLDIMAYYKLNVLHLHLTDDQGWRIEIKSWPKLTAVGGSTEVGGGPGGFYTQEEYRDIVNYAAERFITIVPEVDMPGHTNAASVSYPFLNGNGKTPELYTGTRVGFSTFDTRKDTVYAFIDDVVREISALTPGPYFHIGGDESHVTEKDDYIYFVERVAPIVRKYGKQMIGWDEIATADLDSSSIAQFWADEENAREAVEKGMKVILSPARKAYLDMQYDSVSTYGLHWAAYIPVDSAYIWNPQEYAAGIEKDDILGIEAPLWSETIAELAELEYLAFPRLPGYAELGWTDPSLLSWEDYKLRLAAQAPYFKKMDIRYYPSARVPWPEDFPEPEPRD
ncbi:family 20 glycosylhydrolase [Robiginitalea sp. SC105]|uniref:family 20 glycosylhydrolase n=1 Tax=Robiginitalea sp. SC105 TaxID=2762332 RepID=UPI00163A729F|nr:family 20 glycosylhydrolase [Robiginitalea sp. SC105]MBC2839969.1 beta-N-acetylhexosaminidase [Robiginitalea sp. SC105]